MTRSDGDSYAPSITEQNRSTTSIYDHTFSPHSTSVDEEIPALRDPYAEDQCDEGEHACTEYTHISNIQRCDVNTPLQQSRSNHCIGIAAYIDDSDVLPALSSPKPSQARRKNPPSRKQPSKPWYCISRPIHEQTRDLKISSINKSSSIFFGRLVEKCRSIVEFCMGTDDKEEINSTNIQNMNHN